jgi:hypothetical protein
MIFVLLTLSAVVLYTLGYKIPALLIFFFFITQGFNLIPEEVTELAFISKGSDYAFFILLGMLVIDTLFARKYLRMDFFFKYLIGFGVFLLACILYSKYGVGIGWSDIIRACRYQFFLAAYFVFRNMEKSQLERLLKYLFNVTIILSVLYLLQIVMDKTILNEGMKSKAKIFGMVLPRYYNQPDMIQFFALMSIFCNPHKGVFKYFTMAILMAALLGAFHRSLIGFSFLAIGVGYTLSLSRLIRIRILSVGAALLTFIVVFEGYKFVHSRTYVDLTTVMSGNLADAADIDLNDLQESTFSFRIAHLLERNQYLLDHPVSMVFGAGLLPEDSKNVDRMFDFKVGLAEELTGNIVQVDSGDISYSVLFLKFGYLGTALILFLFIYLMIYFYKKRNNRYAFFSFLYFIFSFGVSFFSSNFIQPIFFLLPLISYHIVKKTTIEKIENGTRNEQD